MSTLVAGIDSSTQSCKVVVRDVTTGAIRRFGQAPHPAGTEVDPEAWWQALLQAVAAAGGLSDVAAASVGGQQHGMVALDDAGSVIRPALLWNDTRSATDAADLVRELGNGGTAAGQQAWAAAIGAVPVASLTVTKVRWLAAHEPENTGRLAALALPHDWLTWRLRGSSDIGDLVTDRSDASGTGYFDPVSDTYRRDLLALALGRDASDVVLPRVLSSAESAGTLTGGTTIIGAGAGDNAAASLGLGMTTGDVTVSLGTSGVVSAVSATPIRDATGTVTGFADATGRYLAMATMINASRVLDATRAVLGVEHDELSDLALSAGPGAGGLVHLPYLDGERTPNLPRATGSLHGMTSSSMSRANLARAAVEGLLCSMAFGMSALTGQGVEAETVRFIGGGARSRAVREIAPAVLGTPVTVPDPSEFVADGMCRQAAWLLAGGSQPPDWNVGRSRTYTAEPTPQVLETYLEQADDVARRFAR